MCALAFCSSRFHSSQRMHSALSHLCRFHLCDADNDGNVSFTEFFAFSLREALARALDGHGVLQDFLSLWDKDAHQALSVSEFRNVAKDLGFTKVSTEHAHTATNMFAACSLLTRLPALLRYLPSCYHYATLRRTAMLNSRRLSAR